MRSLCFLLLASAFLSSPLYAQLDRLPRVKARPVTYYPQEFQKEKARVVLQFVVDTDGTVDSNSIQVISTTNDHFDEAARLSALALIFEPGEKQGVPVRVTVRQPFTFEGRKRQCAFIVTRLLVPECADSIAAREQR
jgi:TonB family protein